MELTKDFLLNLKEVGVRVLNSASGILGSNSNRNLSPMEICLYG